MKMKARASKPDKINRFVLSAGEIVGWVDEKYIKTRQGFFAVLKISGIDIMNYKEDDQELAYLHFGRAEQLLKLPHKYIFMDSNPDLSAQKKYIEHRLKRTTHEYRRFLLQRQLSFFAAFEEKQRDRLAYLSIFADSIKELDENIGEYMSAMTDTAVEICTGTELTKILANQYQIKWEVNDYADI